MTTTQDLQAEYAEAWANLQEAKLKMVDLSRRIGPERVQDYELQGREGSVRLSEMFGDKQDLILIHNMGSECPYCTMWADEFNGVLRHLQDRAGFVVVSPNSVDVQQAVREKRGWTFDMYSAEGTSFIKDMGFESDGVSYNSNAMPGVSTFRKNADGTIDRIAKDFFGPGDLYCSVWHLFDLLADGVGDWEAQLEY
jgi:predicted dithiol-disulfide oxidoreductase (DUF899 family)